MAIVCTMCSAQNMVKGVILGFRLQGEVVYAPFPINIVTQDSGSLVEIRNFLGENTSPGFG